MLHPLFVYLRDLSNPKDATRASDLKLIDFKSDSI